MRFENSYIPYGGYWSTPFAKWQGSLSNLHALSFAADVARKALAQKDIPPSAFDSVVLGMTVPQKRTLYGAPWLAALIGADGISGPWIAQACATGARVLASAGAEIETEAAGTVLTVTADRTSNGPHIYYPNPLGMGGTGEKEDWVVDSFGNDPWAKNSMIQTGENVAAEAGITREQQDEVTLVRLGQYQAALADNAAFHKRYMVWPLEVRDARGKKVLATLEGDEEPFVQDGRELAGAFAHIPCFPSR